MFSSIGVNAQLQLQRPFECVSMVDSALWGDADNVFRFGDTTLYPDNAFTICHWYYGNSESGTFNYTTGRETTSGNRQHQIYIYHDSSGVVNFLTPTAELLTLTAPSPLPKNKWYFIAVTGTRAAGNVQKQAYLYDENQLIVSGTTTTYSAMNSNNNFRYLVGSARNAAGQATYDQRQNSHGVWKEHKSGAFIRSIWNYGRGLRFNDLTTDQKTNLVEWWNLNDWDGTDCTGSVLGENLVIATIGGSNISKVPIYDQQINPASVSGLLAWYGDLVNTGVTKTTLSNDAAITRWDDQSGNGYHLDVRIGSPVYKTADNSINLGTTSVIGRTSSFPVTGQSTTVFIAWKVVSSDGSNNTDTYQLFFGNFDVGYYALSNRQNANSTNIQQLSTQRIYGTPSQVEQNQLAFQTFINTDNTPANYVYRKNQLIYPPSTAGIGTIPSHQAKFAIGGYINNSGLVAFNSTKNINVMEVIIYNGVLPNETIFQIENYLMKKYTV